MTTPIGPEYTGQERIDEINSLERFNEFCARHNIVVDESTGCWKYDFVNNYAVLDLLCESGELLDTPLLTYDEFIDKQAKNFKYPPGFSEFMKAKISPDLKRDIDAVIIGLNEKFENNTLSLAEQSTALAKLRGFVQ